MKFIDLLNKISKNEIEPIIYFRVNLLGHNFIIKYLYFDFIIEKVDSSFNRSLFKKGDSINNILLSALNKKIEIITNFDKLNKEVDSNE